MNKTTNLSQTAQLAAHIQKQQPKWDQESCMTLASSLVRDACWLTRLNEARCNREISKREEKEEEFREKRVETHAKLIGIKARSDGDPRGFSVKLFFTYEDRIYNTWGGVESGWGIG